MRKDEGEVDLGKKIRRLVLGKLSMMPLGFQGEMLRRSQLDIRVWRSGESLSWRSGSGSHHHEDLIYSQETEQEHHRGEWGRKREQDQRENQDQEDRVPGELPSLKTDEMSKGNGEGFTRYKEN